ncbi:MAG: PKD domain-containing protein [Rhizobacter sp.]
MTSKILPKPVANALCRRAAWLALPLTLAACGGGGGGSSAGTGAANTPPTANFTFACVDLTCNFTSTSTDQDVGDAIVAQSWSFGDTAAAPVTTFNPSHTYAAAGTYQVTLMAGDRIGAVGSKTIGVTLTAPAQPAAPHASMTATCASLDCTFTDTTTFDAGSVFQSRSWNFGDGVTVAGTNPVTHSYTSTTFASFNVTLTEVDTTGKTSTSVKTVGVAPAATTLNCAGGGNCSLTLTQAARVTATLVSHSCSAQNNRVLITAPISQTIFPDGCTDAVGTAVAINGGATFAANTTIQVAVVSGSLTNTTLVFPPTIRVSGDFANGWTLIFDDGFGGPGEPDFNDLVILIKAAP